MAKRLTWSQMQNAVGCAISVTAEAIDGESSVTRGAHCFDLRIGGMCQRFVRQTIEAGNGWRPHTWEFGDDEGSAAVALRHMEAEGFRLPAKALLVPGDIVGHRRGPFGHIGLFVGVIDKVPTVCENTSSTRRGTPRWAGTKRTPLKAFGTYEAYRLVTPESVGVYVNGQPVYPLALLIAGRCYVPRRKLADALGGTCEPIEAATWTVNGKPIKCVLRDGMSWCRARDLAALTGATVSWTPGRVEFTK